MTKPANIVFLIDIQNGFARNDLTRAQGGSLYVPDGEKIVEPAADLIRGSSNTVFVLSQDFHPHGHISFASSHQGVVPLQDICLKKGKGDAYRAVAFAVKNAEGATIRHKAVTTDGFGYVTSVLDHAADPQLVRGSIEQKLWLDHCIEGTESALFSPAIMAELPEPLQQDLLHHAPDSLLGAAGSRGNQFFVVRKGTRVDLDSYGIATENDKVSLTKAPDLFRAIASGLQSNGVTSATLSIGGLATNFCVEYSNADLHKHLVPLLRDAGIDTKVQFLPEISKGIDIPTADDHWPNLKAAPKRMASFGTVTADAGEVIRGTLQGRQWALPQIVLAK